MFNMTFFLIAIALSMDSFAVSMGMGTRSLTIPLYRACVVALSFALFQGGMILAGWFLGESVALFISGIDHWIAFLLLGIIGCRMVYESIRQGKKKVNTLVFSIKTILILSFATSIDAFIVGISYAFLNVFIITPVLYTFLITFLLSVLGIFFGRSFGTLVKNKAGILGGMVLIGIGVKILIQHIL